MSANDKPLSSEHPQVKRVKAKRLGKLMMRHYT